MFMNKTIAMLLIGVVGAETAAQTFLEKGIKGKYKYSFLVLGLLLYVAVGIIYYFMLKDGSKMAIANALWNAGTSVLVALVGYLIFGQELSKSELVGLVLIVGGVFLMGIKL